MVSLVVLIVSCGHPYCVLGVGNCEAFSGSGTTITNRLNLTVDNTTMYVTGSNTYVTFTISGGTAPYTISCTNDTSSSYAYFKDSSNNQKSSISTSNTTVTFYAKAQYGQPLHVSAQDNSSSTLYSDVISIYVKASP